MSHDTYRLSLLKIPVTNVDRAARFYQDALGIEPQFVAAEYGWAQLDAGGVPLALYQPGMGGGTGPVGGSLDFHLAVRDLTALADRLSALGALVGDAIQEGDDGTAFVEMRDPDDNTMKIVRLSGD